MLFVRSVRNLVLSRRNMANFLKDLDACLVFIRLSSGMKCLRYTEHAPRKLPVALREKFKDELRRMENLNIIERVTKPTD